MKSAFRLFSIFLLGILMSCTHETQQPQSTRQVNEAQTKTSPATSADSTTSAKSSGERGTPAEAKAMLEKAVAHYNEVGRQQALADFTARKAPFFDRDLYVGCIGPNHVIIANGGFPQLVGMSVDAWKDADGKPLGKAIWDVASSKGEGSVEYRWYNPVSGKLERKISFGQKVGDDVCAVGAYNPK